ncbi:MAG: phasin family protein [Alphaproteobacteria bacterium]|nr:phasin family protein [Alphaproteobacteria bacterium]
MSSKSSAKSSAKKTIKSVLPATSAATFDKVKRNVANNVTETAVSGIVTKMAKTMESKMQNAAEHIEKANRELSTRVEEAASFNSNNLDAAVQAVNVVAEGIKDVNQTICNSIQQALQTAMSTGKAMMGVKNLRDLMEIQTEYLKATFDTVMADTTKISEIAVRCSSQAAEPISARVTEVVEKVSKVAKRAA